MFFKSFWPLFFLQTEQENCKAQKGWLPFAQEHAAPAPTSSLPEGLCEDTCHRKVPPAKALAEVGLWETILKIGGPVNDVVYV